MNELLEVGQDMSVVPHDFRNSNKGKITEIQDRRFLLEVIREPNEMKLNHIMEFYSPTPNGTLYFNSDITKIEGKVLTVRIPLKHRFLQRRAFTRVKFNKEMELKFEDKAYKIKSLDLSFGGLKLTTQEILDVNTNYDLCIPLFKGQDINCIFEPIRIEKKDDGYYTVSGRFQDLSGDDRMTLTQFCMRKNIEDANK